MPASEYDRRAALCKAHGHLEQVTWRLRRGPALYTYLLCMNCGLTVPFSDRPILA